MFFSASRNLGGKNEVVGGKKGAKNRKVIFSSWRHRRQGKIPLLLFFRGGGGDREFYTVSTGKEGGERNEESSRRGEVGIKVCSSGWE